MHAWATCRLCIHRHLESSCACLHAVALLQGAHAFRQALRPSRGPAGFPACIRRRLATCAAALRRRWPAASMMARCRACMLHGHMYTIRRPAQVLHQRQAHLQRLQVRRARPQGRAHAALAAYIQCMSCMSCMSMHAWIAPEEGASHSCMLRPRSPAAGVLGHGRYSDTHYYIEWGCVGWPCALWGGGHPAPKRIYMQAP